MIIIVTVLSNLMYLNIVSTNALFKITLASRTLSEKDRNPQEQNHLHKPLLSQLTNR